MSQHPMALLIEKADKAINQGTSTLWSIFTPRTLSW
jgi:hypothetical protein